MRATDDILLNKGIYTLEDLKEFGEKKNVCPYYLTRQYLYRANIIVFNYAYMIDPKISSAVSGELEKECVVVFDECHNMDNACIEGLTIHINRKMLQLAVKNIEKLKGLVDETKKTNQKKLQNEYNQLLKSLEETSLGNRKQFKNDLLSFKKVDDKEISNIMPGNIRKADHFLAFVRRICIYIKEQLAENELKILHPTHFMYQLQYEKHVDKKGLQFAHDRLNSLLNTLEVIDVEEYSSLKVVVDFGAMIANYEDGFSIIIDPYPEDDLILDPMLIFYCMDASIAVKPLFEKYRNVILTSGTISPLETYAKLLNFKPRIMKSFGNTLPRNAIYPLIVSKGTDQLQMSSKFDDREDKAIIRNYGSLLADLCATVPDGIV
jgi:DNA excision repair protein ERCC-2